MQIARYAATAIFAILLAYVAVVHGMSDAAVRSGNPAAALAIDPGSVSATSLAAEQALGRQDLKAAERYALAAIEKSPRDVRALRVLGVTRSLQGQARAGNELLLKAGALSWRDDATQLWLIRQAMVQRNFVTATQRVDAMLRREQLVSQMLPLMHQLAAIPEAQPAVLDRLSDAPEWRRSFFAKMNLLPKATIASHAALIDAMRAREGSMSREETGWFVGYLVNTGNFALARKVWLGNLSADSRARASTVFDGSFEEDPAADSEQPRYPFEWTFAGEGGAFAAIGSPPMMIGETALNAKSSGGDPTQIARQTILVGPGKHQLQYGAIVGDDLKPEGFEWRVSCVVGGARLPGQLTLGKAVGAARQGVLTFDVPANCPAQLIELVALGGDSVGAEAWFDHVSVQ